jgi:hypothetical protein
MKKIATGVLLLLLAGVGYSQSPDSLRRNTIKLDLTSYLLYRNSIVVSYERVARPNQTWAISGGPQELPPLRAIDDIRVTRDSKAGGFKFGGEYRFYLKKENKFAAPHGVYLGPYASYLNFNNERNIEVDNDGTPETGSLGTKISVLNLGIQVGYQFVLNDRWTFDLIFVGPSVSNYRANMTLEGNFSRDPEDIQNEILQALIDRYPALEDLISDQEVSTEGKLDTWSFGYRYQFLIGYRFGKKR